MLNNRLPHSLCRDRISEEADLVITPEPADWELVALEFAEEPSLGFET